MIDDLLHIFYPRSYTLSNGKVVKEKFNWAPYITIIVIIFSLLCAKITGVKLSVLRDRGYQFFVMLKQMIPPNWSFWADVKKPMLDTIIMSVLGTVFGCLLGLPISFYLSNNFKLNKYYMAVHRGLLSVLRTLPTM
ncbi:MAG: hypothetical protein IKE12_01340, partial [Erysipelotrichaceae bacterium]|nr:hypothetical protein [Erysipelotrichaceae bacterium]